MQLQLLTATVKLFLKKPSSGPQILIQTVLKRATNETDDPDLRDRAFIYWRLLSSDPEAAKEVVLTSKPTIRDERSSLDVDLLNELLHQISTLSSVYYKLPSTFVATSSVDAYRLENDKNNEQEVTLSEVQQDSGDAQTKNPGGLDLLVDLMDGVGAQPQSLSQPVVDDIGEEYGLSTPSLTSTSVSSDASKLIEHTVLLSAEKGAGLEIAGAIFRGSNGNPTYHLTFTNRTPAHLDGFQLQFNKNTFCLSLQQQPQISSVGPGETRNCVLPLSFNGQSSGNFASPVLQVAVKSPQQNQAVFYFDDNVPLQAVLLPDGRMDTSTFVQLWKIYTETVRQVPVSHTVRSVDDVLRIMCQSGWFYISRHTEPGNGQTAVYISGMISMSEQKRWILLDITFDSTTRKILVKVRTNVEGLADMVFASLERVLSR